MRLCGSLAKMYGWNREIKYSSAKYCGDLGKKEKLQYKDKLNLINVKVPFEVTDSHGLVGDPHETTIPLVRWRLILPFVKNILYISTPIILHLFIANSIHIQ